jgi:dihydrofolate reductase
MVIKDINIIAAMTNERVIGINGSLPWHIPDEMKLFKQITENNIVIMGKNTWESLPEKFKPLPNRTNIIVSSSLGEQKGANICRNIVEALIIAKNYNGQIYCIGGAGLFYQMLPLSQTLHISWIKNSYIGDTYFPAIDFKQWIKKEKKEFAEFTYMQYLRKSRD